MAGDWRKLYNEELLLSFPNFILVLKSRRMGPDRQRRGEERRAEETCTQDFVLKS
jgi:hypothetical protein